MNCKEVYTDILQDIDYEEVPNTLSLQNCINVYIYIYVSDVYIYSRKKAAGWKLLVKIMIQHAVPTNGDWFTELNSLWLLHVYVCMYDSRQKEQKHQHLRSFLWVLRLKYCIKESTWYRFFLFIILELWKIYFIPILYIRYWIKKTHWYCWCFALG